ncbi:MAG: MerR family transcriptional regulator [Sulfuricaulis sp.]
MRQYEQRGLLRPCKCTESGYHLYDEHALARLRFVVAGKEAGLSLEELAVFAQVFDTGSVRRALARLEKHLQRRLEHIARFKQELDRLHEASRHRRNACRAATGVTPIKEEA